MTKTTKIRWVIAHEPLKLFVRAAKDFEREVNAQQSVEKIEIEVMTLNEYSERYNNGVAVTKHDLLDLMEQGKIEMSQMYTTWLAEYYEKDFLALEMPFIFRDHDHATRVLEGPIGERLLEKLTNNSNVRGLSFTYSGGFRALISNKRVSTLQELTSSIQRSNRNPVAQATLRAIGVKDIHVCEIEDLTKQVEAGKCEGGETVYSRVYPLGQNEITESVLDTKHSLFLTTMIIGDRFWESLSPEVKAIIKQAAINAGRSERAETILDGEEAKQKLIAEGKLVKDLSEQETAWFKEQTKVVYDQFQDYFEPGLIDGIIRS